jgi:predicted DCC family thiol-disulfide oxidoreductase YuxK
MKNKNGWVCFDAHWTLCVALARRFEPLLRRHRFELVPLQTPWVKRRLDEDASELLSEMRLLTVQGLIHGGADALVEIARHIWWAKPVYWLSLVPLARSALATGYRWVARNRTCFGGSCVAGARQKRLSVSALAWIPALVPPILAIGFGRILSDWIWMWVIAVALFIGAKWVTIIRFLRSGQWASPGRLLAYSLLWPGMDARAFCGHGLVPSPPVDEWTLAAVKMLFGAAVLWVGVRLTGATHPLISGWTGMVGIVLLLHFGLFHFLSLLWRALGINAPPIMQSPAAATSLSRFWGGSWNAAFTDLMHEHLFKPLTRHIGSRGALVLVFLVSGALHELVISLPAHGGFGLPTIYFGTQALGLFFERSKLGKGLGLGSGRKGWCFVALVAGTPAFWLFHPVFIHNVITPMLHAIGAI